MNLTCFLNSVVSITTTSRISCLLLSGDFTALWPGVQRLVLWVWRFGVQVVGKRRLELRLLVAWAIMLWYLQDDWWDGADRVTNCGFIVVVRRIRG